ncbi:MAG TPA: helix-turn-helix domain-containing protein [Polyangiaceae bacterium]|jgi:excisionase family DNA binding protein
MEHEFITMREACKILGVSRTMVQKLVASGELERGRQEGKLVFERAKVEALAHAREVAKVQHDQDAEQREQRQAEAQLHRRDVEFDAWAKRNDEEDVRERRENSQARIGDQLDQLRAKVRDMEEAESHRRVLAHIDGLGTKKPGSSSSDGDLAAALLLLLPAAAMLAIGYLDSKTAKPDQAVASKPVVASATQAPGEAIASPQLLDEETLDPVERELFTKIREGRATAEDFEALTKCALRRGGRGKES